MTDKQIELLRLAIQRELWAWAEQMADEKWKEFQQSFNPVEIDGIKDHPQN